MYFALMGKLNARRQNLTEQDEKGFTLIELLVVVIIIGILAAIAIPVYLGVQNNAKDSSVQNDVSNLKTAIVSMQTNGGGLPTPFPTALNGTTATPSPFPGVTGTGAQSWSDAGATLGTNTSSLTWVKSTSDGFCITGTSSTNKVFYATASKGVSTTPCSAS